MAGAVYNCYEMKRANTLALYFATLLVVTIPFWVLGSATHIDGLPFDMQLNVLVILVLPLVTIYFIRRLYRASLKRVFRDCLPSRQANTLGLAVAFLTMPLAGVVVFVATQFFVGFDGWSVPLYLLPVYFSIYYLAAAFEEIGWTWFATPILSKKMGLVGTGIVIGGMWAAVHTWPWFQQNGWQFMFGMIMLSILCRIIMTWLYLKNGRQLWLNITFHAMINTTFTFFYHGSPYANPLAYVPVLFVITFIIIGLPATKK